MNDNFNASATYASADRVRGGANVLLAPPMIYYAGSPIHDHLREHTLSRA